MKRRIAAALLTLAMAAGLAACGGKQEDQVVIMSVLEDNRNEYLKERLDEKFPDYDIQIQFVSTGDLAAKLKSEQTDTECDIVMALQAVYMEQLKDYFADLSDYDQSDYVEDLVTEHGRFLVWERFSGCIIINPEVLEEKGLERPGSYEDLLKPEYKSLISMPDPKTSSTGYIFLLNLVNTWGEEKAFTYFKELSDHILQFTSSGSGPVNALVQGEAAIGLGITYQPVTQINDGVPLELVYFEEGAPYDIDGYAMIEGREEKKAVKEVFDYLYSDLIHEDKAQFSPEVIFKDQKSTLPNYPGEIPYGDMTGNLDVELKERLLEKWDVSNGS